MNKKVLNVVAVFAVSAAVALSGCGNGSSPAAGPGQQTVSGVVASSAPISAKVTLQDFSAPAVTQTTEAGADGKYSFEVSGLKAPFIVSAEAPASGATGTTMMYSFANGAGKANINPFSHVTVGAAAELSDDEEMSESRNRMEKIRNNHRSVIEALKAKLAPLFLQYGVTKDPVNDDDDEDSEDDNESEGLNALFADVRIKISRGDILVTNKLTNGLIFKASVGNIAGGTFYPENLPVTSAPVDGAALYASKCASCHGPLATSDQRGASADDIREGIEEVNVMKSLASLTDQQRKAISAALADTSTPSACSYAYSAWGTCQSNGTQTRTMLTSSPAGCTGTPVLSQTCTYTPPTPSACSYTYSAWGACQSNGTQTRTTTSATPAGCTGTPVLSQTCTYTPPTPAACTYTYNAWGACQSNGTQTRTTASATPAGCTGTPVLTQTCTYTPPSCNYTYSAWGACQSNGTQTRTTTGSSPAGCSGTPVLTQNCTYTPPTPACGSCHTIPPSSGRHSRHTSFASCSTCHGSGYSTTAVNTATHNNGVKDIVSSLNFNASTKTCASPGCHGSRTW